jgi:hypothetical protein
VGLKGTGSRVVDLLEVDGERIAIVKGGHGAGSAILTVGGGQCGCEG